MYDADTARGLRQRIIRARARLLRLSVLAGASLVGCAVLASTANASLGGVCANASTPVSAASHRVLDRAVVCLVNEQRRAHGLRRLHTSQELNRSAQGWTNFMVDHSEFTHGGNWTARFTAVGFRWISAGENIATGFRTPAQVVNIWMGSAGHCRNILAPVFTSVGTGVDAKGMGGMRNTGTWTQDFGRRRGQHAPSNNWGAADGCPY